MTPKLNDPRQSLSPHNPATDDEIWWRNAVIYQIYPRSFQDSNDDGIGDLQGIFERLDYIEALGVDAVWLSPIFPSPMADFGYDITNYQDIDPLFGSLALFDRLLAGAHERGLKIILDYVANHTSDEHPWFRASRSSRSDPKRDWYIWRGAGKNGGPPNNWRSFFGGSAWTRDPLTEQYYLHLFSPQQPDLNWRNPEVVEAMHEVLRFWLDRGVDGFRMDAVTMMIKHADLPDMPPADGLLGIDLLQKHIYVHNQPEVHDLIRDFRQLFEEYPGHRVIIGETGDLDPEKLATFYGRNLDGMHLPFNFIPMAMVWQAAAMKKAITAYYTALPPGATPNFVFGNHDISRLATRYGWKNHRSVAMLLLTLGGVATLFNGDELGMTDGDIPPDQILDPVGKRAGREQSRDVARTPMPWSAEPNAGFTAANVEPWLPLASNFETVNVFQQETDLQSTLHFYRELIALRKNLPALKHGSLSIVEGGPEDILAYLRRAGEQCLLVVINFAAEEFVLDLSELTHHARLRLSSAFSQTEAIDIKQMVVKPHESQLVQLGWGRANNSVIADG